MNYQEINKKTLLKKLKQLGLKKITIYYSGSCDDGMVEEPDLPDHKEIQVPFWDKSSHFDGSQWVTQWTQKEMPLPPALVFLAEIYLQEKYAGWENNDGADGEFELDIENEKITWDHRTRHTEYDLDSYEL